MAEEDRREALETKAVEAGEAMRGRLFTDLDRLAFALELEAAERVAESDTDAAQRLTDQRLGVRLAQRLVSGVWAEEVNVRLQGLGNAYEERTGGGAADAD